MAFFFFFNDPATTEIYTLPLHDALPIWIHFAAEDSRRYNTRDHFNPPKSSSALVFVLFKLSINFSIASIGRSEGTRLNSSHSQISYAVFCLKKKKIPYEP